MGKSSHLWISVEKLLEYLLKKHGFLPGSPLNLKKYLQREPKNQQIHGKKTILKPIRSHCTFLLLLHVVLLKAGSLVQGIMQLQLYFCLSEERGFFLIMVVQLHLKSGSLLLQHKWSKTLQPPSQI